MATLMLTPSRFSSSLSGSQAPYRSHDAPSIADTLPSIDFNFNDLRERMSQFTARFDEFIERGRKRVLEERNAFRMSVAELEENARHKEQSIAALEDKSSSHAENLAKEAAETEEMQHAISTLSLQREAHLSRRDELKSSISELQIEIKHRREAQAAHQRLLDAQARQNIPELRFWEELLGLRIEGTGVEDCLRFVFLFAGGEEAWFVLKMGGREYEVGDTTPEVERDGVDNCVRHLAESRQLGGFLKGMRGLLLQGLKG